MAENTWFSVTYSLIKMKEDNDTILLFSYILTSTNWLNGFIDENAYRNFIDFATGLAISVMILNALYLLGLFDYICEFKRRFVNGR